MIRFLQLIFRDHIMDAYQRKQRNARIARWFGIVLGTAAVVGLLVWIGTQQDAAKSGRTLETPISSADWTKGNPEAKVTIVEYSDFQCPSCAAFYPMAKELMAEYSDRVYFAYRHFPISNKHPLADDAAYAAEAAGKQGKFYEMHDLLFERQNDWTRLSDPTETFASYANEIGLDVNQYTTDVASDEAVNAVSDDYFGGLRSQVMGTPTFYINDVALESYPRNYEEFKAIIDAKLAE